MSEPVYKINWPLVLKQLAALAPFFLLAHFFIMLNVNAVVAEERKYQDEEIHDLETEVATTKANVNYIKEDLKKVDKKVDKLDEKLDRVQELLMQRLPPRSTAPVQ